MIQLFACRDGILIEKMQGGHFYIIVVYAKKRQFYIVDQFFRGLPRPSGPLRLDKINRVFAHTILFSRSRRIS